MAFCNEPKETLAKEHAQLSFVCSRLCERWETLSPSLREMRMISGHRLSNSVTEVMHAAVAAGIIPVHSPRVTLLE